MADQRKQKTEESRLNDVLAGDDELGRDDHDENEEKVRDARDGRTDSVTAIPVDDRAMHDDRDE